MIFHVFTKPRREPAHHSPPPSPCNSSCSCLATSPHAHRRIVHACVRDIALTSPAHYTAGKPSASSRELACNELPMIHFVDLGTRHPHHMPLHGIPLQLVAMASQPRPPSLDPALVCAVVEQDPMEPVGHALRASLLRQIGAPLYTNNKSAPRKPRPRLFLGLMQSWDK